MPRFSHQLSADSIRGSMPSGDEADLAAASVVDERPMTGLSDCGGAGSWPSFGFEALTSSTHEQCELLHLGFNPSDWAIYGSDCIH